MGEIVLFALLSAVYPTLIAATIVMLLLPKADRLMLGFWAGAMIASVVSGLVIVFALDGSSVVKTTRHSVSPAVDLAIAGLLGLAAIALAKGEDERLRERRRGRHPRGNRKAPKWQQRLRDGNAWHTFVVGIVLSFPGVWYLAALDRIAKLDYRTLVEVLVVVGFCLVQLTLIEVPMLAFKFWPRQTPIAIQHAKSWASEHSRHYVIWGLAIIAGLLAIIGVIGLAR